MSSRLFCCHAFVLLVTLKAMSFASNSSSCGVSEVKSEGRFASGTPSKLNQWPWAAVLFAIHANKSYGKIFYCNGVLISEYYVLTTASCLTSHYNSVKPLPPSMFVVRLGTLNITSDQGGAPPIDFKVKDVYQHPGFANFSKESRTFPLHDIALLKLDKKVTFSKSIRPICLPTVNMIKDTFGGETAYVTGWDKHKKNVSTFYKNLIHAPVTVLSNKACSTAFMKINKFTVQKAHLCTRVQLCRGRACWNENGGSLNYFLNNKWYSIGVAMMGHKCDHEEDPGIYTRTTEYLDWIKKTAHLKCLKH